MLDNGDEAIRPGMLLTVEVRSNPREAMAIPEIAILDQADGAYVYRVVARGKGGTDNANVVLHSTYVRRFN